MALAHVAARSRLVAPMLLIACRSPATTADGQRDEPPTATQAALDETLIAGRRYNCRLTSAGELQCWGSDADVEVPDRESITGAIQLAMGSTPPVYTGERYSGWPEPLCARLSDGTIACDRAAPAMGPASHVALGYDRACAVLGRGEILCWSLHSDGFSQDLAASRYAVPGAVTVAVAAAHACALTQLGLVECWGFDDCPPRPIPGFGIGVDISAHVDTCVVDIFGAVRCLAPTSCPDPEVSLRSTPNIAPARLVAAGYEVNCAAADSTVACWPSSASSATTPRLARTIELSKSAKIRELAVGAEHACVRTDADAVECWGSNTNHQLDPGAASMLIQTPRIVPGIEQAEEVFVSYYRSCARSAAGDVSCWGAAGEPEPRDPLPWSGVPHPVPRPTGAAVFHDPMTDGFGFGFLTAEGQFDYWASDTGKEPNSATARSPGLREALRKAQSRGGPLRVERAEIYNKELHNKELLWCVLTDSGSPTCAISPSRSATTDRPLQAFDGARDIAICALAWITDAEGALTSLRLWGGELPERPTRVELPAPATDVACSAFDACARLEDGSVWCWSAPPRNDTALYAEEPRSIPLKAPAHGLTMGPGTACIWTHDGRVECWGEPTAPALTPGALASVRDATQVAIDRNHGCLVHTGGTVSCWGGNRLGQVGLGSGAWRARPVEGSAP